MSNWWNNWWTKGGFGLLLHKEDPSVRRSGKSIRFGEVSPAGKNTAGQSNQITAQISKVSIRVRMQMIYSGRGVGVSSATPPGQEPCVWVW